MPLLSTPVTIASLFDKLNIDLKESIYIFNAKGLK